MTCHGDVGAMPNSSPNHHGKSLGDMPGSRCFECFDVCCEVPMLSMLFLVPRVLWDDLCYCLRSRVVFEILGFLKGRGRWGISFLEHEPIKELGYTSYFMYFIEQAGIPTVLKANVLTVDTFKQWHTVPSAKKKSGLFSWVLWDPWSVIGEAQIQEADRGPRYGLFVMYKATYDLLHDWNTTRTPLCKTPTKARPEIFTNGYPQQFTDL